MHAVELQGNQRTRLMIALAQWIASAIATRVARRAGISRILTPVRSRRWFLQRFPVRAGGV
jgi:hypothetical protein